MSLHRPDRALRRLVAELATTTPEDVQAILAGLDKPQRDEVRTLLAAYLGEPPAQPKRSETVATPAPAPKLDGLSPWLAARLEQERPNQGGTPEPITPAKAGAQVFPSVTAPWKGLGPGFRRGDRRLGGDLGSTGDDAAFAMTPTALNALKACAVALQAHKASPSGNASS